MPQPSIFLGTYQFYVNKLGEPQRLNNFDGNGSRILEWIRRELLRDGLHASNIANALSYRKGVVKKDGDHTIYGKIYCGDSGFGSDFVDETGASEYKRTPAKTELMPFYFQVYAPPGSPLGILVLQRLGNRGPYTVFSEHLRPRFGANFKGLSWNMEPFIPGEVLKKLSAGRVQMVKFTKWEAPKGLENIVRHNGLRPEDVYFEQRIVAKKGRSIRGFRGFSELLKRKDDRDSIPVPAEWRSAGDEVSITVRQGGKQRTLTFGKGREIVPYEDVTSRCKTNTDNHPELDSIHEPGNELVFDVRKELKIKHAE